MASDQDRRRSILERLTACDTSTLSRLDALLTDRRDSPADSGSGYLAHLRAVADSDVDGLVRAERSYGDSWKRRGGVDTFHMLTRKWDRVEQRVAAETAAAAPYDVFEHLAADPSADGLLDDVRDLRRYLMLVEAEVAARRASGGDSGRGFLDQLRAIADGDVAAIEEKERSYGGSWKRRGGIAAFMMLARKWDRIVQRVSTRVEASAEGPGAARENVLEHAVADRRAEGLLDDVRDLRRYLLLVEAEMAARGEVTVGSARDNRDAER